MQLHSGFLLLLLISRCVDVSGNGSPSKFLRSKRDVKDCNFKFNVSGSGGTLTSPDYPDKYPSNADCRWLLETTDPNITLLLRIDTLQIEPDTNCKLDYLQVYLGSSTLAPSLGPFCGNIKDRVIKTNSSTLLVVFHSDPIYEDKGFSIDYFTQSAGDCKSSLTDPSGVIRSPGFPNNYPDSTDCWTLIEVHPNKKIALYFESLDLEYGDNCTYDYIQIYDGATRHSPLMGQICKLQKETSFESSSNQLLLHFHSDESVNRKGYKAVYSAIDKRSIKVGDCLWEKDDFNGTIASPNYPANYPSNSNCSLWLQAPENQQIMIVFDTLQLEIDSNCSYDYLQIKDGPPPDSKSMGSFCGKISEPKELTSTSNEVNIIFHSDDFAEFSGFKLRYWFLNNETEESATKSTKTGDVGKASFEIRPENATLPIGSSYMLRCSTRHPLAKIRWLKDDRFLSGGTPLPGLKALNNNTLWIKSMDHHLSGQYTCVIVTAEETISSSAYILTESGSRNNESSCGIVFRKVPRDASFAEGEFAYLECLAAGTNVQFSWEKDGISLQRSKRITILQNGLLYIDRVTLDDAGVYSCVAYDEIAKCQKKASAFLQVSERAKIDEICGMPKAGKPSNDIPLMEHGKIVGGHNTKKGAYPWQVMLWEPTLKSFCGGSLLNERWIATAAHCFVHYRDLRWDRIIIKLGKYDREREEVEEFRTGIADPSSIVVHPAYNKLTFDNDLALVRLRDHVRFSDYILPICLGDREMGETFLSMDRQTPRRIHMGTVTGWGKLKESGPSPRYLQEIRLPIVDQKICTESTNYTVSRNMFCAGYAQEILGDACHGDSGGPFLMSHENRWYLLGIVSWGEGCGKANKYGFYTRIPNYLPWIKGIMKS